MKHNQAMILCIVFGSWICLMLLISGKQVTVPTVNVKFWIQPLVLMKDHYSAKALVHGQLQTVNIAGREVDAILLLLKEQQ